MEEGSETSARAGVLVAADSFLLDQGRVRGFDLHWQRFSRACQEVGAAPPDRDATATALPRRGRWFPRIELALLPSPRPSGPTFRLRLRPDATTPGRPATCWVDPEPDPRTAPRRKGPDLAALAGRHAQAQRRGADEALLLDRDGHAIETAFSSLLWWEDGALVTVPDDAPILDGVTRRLLLELAHDQSVPVRHVRRRPQELLNHELWIANARHGIRPVTAIHPHGAAASTPRAAEWQVRLASLARPL